MFPSLGSFLSLSFTGALTQAIRNFAKSLEGWLTNAMSTIPQKMIQTKVDQHCSLLLFTQTPCTQFLAVISINVAKLICIKWWYG